jgi:hypothetical protein
MTPPHQMEKELEEDSLGSESCWSLLNRVLASAQFRRSTRLRDFLTYVGRRSLKEGCDQIHEQEIGCKVFGRPDGYDSSVDTIVRVNATELRKRVELYFDSEGRHETLVMEIPRGSYIPTFHPRPHGAEVLAEPPLSLDVPVSDMAAAVPEVVSNFNRSRRLLAGTILASLIIVALACTSVSLWMQNRALKRSFFPWRYSPSVAAFWSDFLDGNRDTDVVMSDSFFKLAQDISKKPITLNEYLSGSYVDQLLAHENNPELSGILSRVSTWKSSNGNHLKLALRILAMDPLHKNIHIYYAHDYRPDLIQQDNMILLGSRLTNPWDDLVGSRMNFVPKFDSNDITTITNLAPGAGEQAFYARTDTVGYCLVAYLPNPSGKNRVLLIEGTSAEATQAGGDFLLSEDWLSSFQKMLHVSKLPYFEMLLKTSQLTGTPLTATVEAYRTYPNLR